MYKIIALMGKSGAGKDALLQTILKKCPYLHEIVSCTTRPPREGEIEGKNYNFLSSEEFTQKLVEGRMIEATVFNDWCYGTCIDSLDEGKINIGVYNPSGIDIMLYNPNIEIHPVFINVPDKIRLLRQLTREDNPNVGEIIRRYSADEEDFSCNNMQNIEIKYCVNNDGALTLEEVAQEIIKYINQLQV